MKLKIGDKVYLQKYEVVYILHKLNSFPASIMQETFGGDDNDYFFVNGSADGFRFACVYEEPESVRWLMEQDWIVDYDVYIEMSLDELKVLQETFKAEYSAGIDEFNAKDEAYKETHFEEENEKLDNLGHKIISFGNLISFCKGEVKFGFPDEYQGITTILGASGATSISQKRFNFFARLFGRDAQ